MRTLLLAVWTVLDAFAGVAAIRTLIRAGIGTFFVAVFASAISSFVGAGDVLTRSEAPRPQFEVPACQALGKRRNGE